MDDPRDTTPLSPARRNAQRELHDHQLTEIAQLARTVREAEHRLAVARGSLDSRLYYLHEDGLSIAELSRAATISRETTYKAIDRYRASIPPSSADMLPDIPGDELNDFQLDGLACIVCGVGDGRPLEPVGFGPRGQVFAHSECHRSRGQAHVP